jgi:CBS-domain-containing membrane protein
MRSLEEATALMAQQRIRRLAVVDDDHELVGVLSLEIPRSIGDVVRGAANAIVSAVFRQVEPLSLVTPAKARVHRRFRACEENAGITSGASFDCSHRSRSG